MGLGRGGRRVRYGVGVGGEEAVKSGGSVAWWWCFPPMVAPPFLDRVRDRFSRETMAPVNLAS
jgi:hypothetical protein